MTSQNIEKINEGNIGEKQAPMEADSNLQHEETSLSLEEEKSYPVKNLTSKSPDNMKFDSIKEMVNNITHGDKKYDKKTLLKMRAGELAKDLRGTEIDIEAIHVVEFMLSNERYAIEADYIMEVYPLKNLKKIACTPPHITGVINFHGQILPVVNLKVVMDLPSSEIGNRAVVLILMSEEMEFGILADFLVGNNHIPISNIQTSLSTLSNVQEEYFKGITTDDTVILNGLKILSDSNLIVNDKL